MPRGRYRVLVIYEDSSTNRKSYTVNLDGEFVGELGEESLIMANTDDGWHTLTFSTTWGVEKTSKFSINEEQYITRVFIHNNLRNKIEVRIDSGASAMLAATMRGQTEEPQEQPEPELVYVQDIPQTRSAPARRTRIWPCLIAFVVGVLCTAAFFLFIFPALGGGKSASATSAITARETTSSAARTTAEPLSTIAPEFVSGLAQLPSYIPPDGRNAGTLGSFYVEITGGVLTQNSDGSYVLVVTYNWTNNSGVTVSAAEAMTEQAFQSGVQLDLATPENADTFDMAMRSRGVRSGYTVAVQTAFTVPNPTATVEFELSEYPGAPDGNVSMIFDLASLR